MKYGTLFHRYYALGSFLFLVFRPSFALPAEPVQKEVRWQEAPNSSGYILEVQNSKSGNRVVYEQVRRPPFSFYVEPGEYRLRILTLNRWGQPENISDWTPFRIEAAPPPEPEPIPVVTEDTVPENIVAEEVKDTEKVPEEVSIEVLIPEPGEVSPLPPKDLSRNIYVEIYSTGLPVQVWDLPGAAGELQFNHYALTYSSIARLRAGYKNIGRSGLYFGVQSEVFASSALRLHIDSNLEIYSIPDTQMYSLDVGYKFKLSPGFYITANLSPLSLFRQASLISYQGTPYVIFFGPMSHIQDSGLLDAITSDLTENREGTFQLYLSTWYALFGAAVKLEYNTGKHLVLNLSAFFWADYARFSFMDWALEATAGFRF
ncbi:hypothetical protein P0082_04590 [Candidatus Haliotispira prima]|uniref:Outer membrane protein beta-barrel domain-containing protein n=1 Tax=Candidatus Haliotispira prima TaxID=3034016 RepID=A0ABY8MJJ4_9SPIO|nr:hypothetical protein P0082_04590 [Candidatus Haliotispira prima]